MAEGRGAARRGTRSVRAALAVAAGALVGILTAAGPAAGQGVDETCVLTFTRSDPATANVAFPDEGATYWTVSYVGVRGTRIRISGEFPHARYMSFVAYDALVRPIDALADVDVAPEGGSTNPFAAGADRGAEPRRYTAFVELGPRPADPSPNTLYTGSGQNGAPNASGVLMYRVYVPDRGLNETGGVGLPQVVLERDGEEGEPLSPPEADCRRARKPTVSGVNEAVAAASPPAAFDVARFPGRNPPRWRKFVNLPQAVTDFFLGGEGAEAARDAVRQTPLVQVGGSGGFLSNPHNAYVATTISRAFGQVLALRGRAPTFPDTRPGTAVMPGEVDVRYWSLCQNEFFSQRFIACRTDDQTVLDASGSYTYVVSTPEQRPANATAACGVTWIPWGPVSEGVLILRHMLPDPSFAGAIQRAEYEREADTMGAYLPTGRYFQDKAAFEALGCPPAP